MGWAANSILSLLIRRFGGLRGLVATAVPAVPDLPIVDGPGAAHHGTRGDGAASNATSRHTGRARAAGRSLLSEVMIRCGHADASIRYRA